MGGELTARDERLAKSSFGLRGTAPFGLNFGFGLEAPGLCLLVGLAAAPLGLCHASFGLPRRERDAMGLGKDVAAAGFVLHPALT